MKTNDASILQQYKAVTQVFSEWKKVAVVPVKIHLTVEEPTSETMHFQANNISKDMNGFVEREDGTRGTRLEYICAVSDSHVLLKTLLWERGEYEKRAKDIFQGLASETVVYLMFVSVYDWHEAIIEETFGSTGELFGEPINEDLYVTVYPRDKSQFSWSQLIEKADSEKKERDEAYLHSPKDMAEYPGIWKAITKGCRLHAFLSGGGLRVVRIEDSNDTLLGYGESPHVEEALAYANEDYLAGQQPYARIYGQTHTHYLTGDTHSTSNLDWWIRKGSTFDCFMEKNVIVFILKGYADYHMPDWVMKKAELTPGVPVVWENRGFTYNGVYQESLFANGAPGYSSHVSQSPKGKRDPWFYKITKTGKGSTFWEAITQAFQAQEKEVIE